jgi:hypothetical protein
VRVDRVLPYGDRALLVEVADLAAVAAVRAALGEATFAAAWAEGRGMTLEQAIAEAFYDPGEDAQDGAS